MNTDTLLFIAAFFGAYTVQAVTGFAGNVLCMPAGLHLIGLATSVVVLNVMGFINCGQLALMNRKHVNRPELLKMTLVMLIFMLVGIYLDTILPLDILVVVYGVITLIIGLKNLIFRNRRFLPEWVLWFVLAGAGLMQGMFVAGGALLVIYAIQKFADTAEFRATLSALWTVLNFIYGCIAFVQGHFTMEVGLILLFTIPLGFLATFLGNRISARIDKEVFLRIVYALLVVIGAILLFTSEASPLFISL